MRATVYLVTHRASGNTYVGLTRFTVAKRWAEHVGSAGRLPSWLHRAIAKHGADAFDVAAVASCLDLGTARDVERDVIASFRPTYNQTAGGEFTVGRRVSPEVVARIAAGNRGQKRTLEQRAARSARKKAEFAASPEKRAAATARLHAVRHLIDHDKRIAAASAACATRVWSDESRAKLSASCMGRKYGRDVIDRMAAKKCKPVECIDLACSFDSILEAAAATGVYFTNISRVCREKRGTAGGMRFQFV